MRHTVCLMNVDWIHWHCGLQGVGWIGIHFNPTKNIDLVEKRIASVETTAHRFEFQKPTSYYQHKWEIHRFSSYLSSFQNIKRKKWTRFQEKFQMEQTKFCIELDKFDKGYLVSLLIGKCLTLHLWLVECQLDRMTLWYRFSILDAQGYRCESKCMYWLWVYVH